MSEQLGKANAAEETFLAPTTYVTRIERNAFRLIAKPAKFTRLSQSNANFGIGPMQPNEIGSSTPHYRNHPHHGENVNAPTNVN